MNRPSRTDEPQASDGYNQSPPQLANDLTTNQDLNGISNTRALRRARFRALADSDLGQADPDPHAVARPDAHATATATATPETDMPSSAVAGAAIIGLDASRHAATGGRGVQSWPSRIKHAVITFGKFVGPGFMVAVAYSMYYGPPSPVPGQEERES